MNITCENLFTSQSSLDFDLFSSDNLAPHFAIVEPHSKVNDQFFKKMMLYEGKKVDSLNFVFNKSLFSSSVDKLNARLLNAIEFTINPFGHNDEFSHDMNYTSIKNVSALIKTAFSHLGLEWSDKHASLTKMLIVNMLDTVIPHSNKTPVLNDLYAYCNTLVNLKSGKVFEGLNDSSLIAPTSGLSELRHILNSFEELIILKEIHNAIELLVNDSVLSNVFNGHTNLPNINNSTTAINLTGINKHFVETFVALVTEYYHSKRDEEVFIKNYDLPKGKSMNKLAINFDLHELNYNNELLAQQIEHLLRCGRRINLSIRLNISASQLSFAKSSLSHIHTLLIQPSASNRFFQDLFRFPSLPLDLGKNEAILYYKNVFSVVTVN